MRAAMVKHVRQWKWSSYRTMLGDEPRPAWLHAEWLPSQFGSQRARQVARYIEFVQQGIRGPRVWENLRGRIFLGTDEFVEMMQARLESDGANPSREIPRLQRRAVNGK